jgi:hypothetical protein
MRHLVLFVKPYTSLSELRSDSGMLSPFLPPPPPFLIVGGTREVSLSISVVSSLQQGSKCQMWERNW